MDNLMFKELVRRRVIPVVSIMIGSIFLASCSSGVSRFDFPMFGLSSDEDNRSTSSLPLDPTIAPSANDLTQYSADNGLAGFENDRKANSVVGGSSDYNTRNSYLPPQKAAPEVRAARYGAVDRAPTPSYGRDQTGANMRQKTNAPARYDARPMKPIVEARRSFLPAEPSGYDYNSRKSIKSRPNAKRATPSAPVKTIARSTNGIDSVTVAQGDTLYSIGRRYNVSVVELMEQNGLDDSNLTVGQQLDVSGSKTHKAQVPQMAQVREKIKARSSGSYAVRPGESFQNIAAKHGVSSADLAELNGITDPGSIRAGEVLILPARAKIARKPRKTFKKMAKRSPRSPSELTVRKVKTQSINLGSSQTKSVRKSRKPQTVAMKRSRNKGATSSAFRWPVRGRIIGKFGPRTDGTHNDGINLAVPNGTKVKAAEEGVVAYAGSELEGYGNLVLIRHSNDWVSAYAHNDRLMVKRGEKIKRGQVIARAGTSGSVEVPQVHFELRKGSKPVDPTKFMAGT